MGNIPWYSEASLHAPGRVFCAGSLAQCVRKWQRLAEPDQDGTYIKLSRAIDGRMKLDHDDLVSLASHDELRRV